MGGRGRGRVRRVAAGSGWHERPRGRHGLAGHCDGEQASEESVDGLGISGRLVRDRWSLSCWSGRFEGRCDEKLGCSSKANDGDASREVGSPGESDEERRAHGKAAACDGPYSQDQGLRATSSLVDEQ